MTIPANIDHVAIVRDLNKWGIADQKVEIICGLASGHVDKLRKGVIQQMRYQGAARLHNFWAEECRALGGAEVVPIPANIDASTLLEDLNRWGRRDFEIERMCGLVSGHIQHIKRGRVSQLIYQRAARLYNLWVDDFARCLKPENNQTAALSS